MTDNEQKLVRHVQFFIFKIFKETFRMGGMFLF